jgi:Ca2+-binding RTX toxin-like protein
VLYTSDDDEAAGVGVDVNLLTGSATDGWGNTDTLIDIEAAVGSIYKDTLIGDNDTVQGDLLVGWDGDDSIVGNDGNDNLIGDSTLDPTVAGDDTIDGGAGDDLIRDNAGNDSLLGGDGDDRIRGNAGNDTLIGGESLNDNDRADYSEAASAIEVTADTVEGSYTVTNDGDGGVDALSEIETVIGSHDTVSGDTMTGGGFTDIFLGLDGDDTLIGGAGDDRLGGRQGSDSIDGGADFDIAVFSGQTFDPRVGQDFFGVVVDLDTGGGVGSANDEYTDTSLGFTDTLVSIEGVWGTPQSDTITGNSVANELSGFGDADVLNGEGGNDTLEGGAGNDILNGGTETDTAVYAGDIANYVITDTGGGTFRIEDTVGGEGTDTLTDVENGDFNGNVVDLSTVAVAPLATLSESTTQDFGASSTDTSGADTTSADPSESLGEGYSITSPDDGGALASVESAGV